MEIEYLQVLFFTNLIKKAQVYLIKRCFSGGWQRHPDKTMYFDREKEGVWLRFALKNEAPNHEKIYLELDLAIFKECQTL